MYVWFKNVIKRGICFWYWSDENFKSDSFFDGNLLVMLKFRIKEKFCLMLMGDNFFF